MGAIEDVKDRIDTVELIGETVKLRKSGKNYTGFCPFHPNTRTPAFVVFPENGNWRCFGACAEGGDVLSFVMKREGWDFQEALGYLAERAGVELKPRTAQQEAEDEVAERLRELLEACVTYFRQQLAETENGKPAYDYVRGRKLSEATIESFELGYAVESWEALKDHLDRRGYKEDEMLAAGVLSEREGGGTYDRFRNRVMIPIRDDRGRMAGFGARILDPNDQPKFLNSPQTSLFDKGRLLYGLDKARQAIRSSKQAVLVEGYLDVIALHQAGFENVVSPMGTALTEAQLRKLKRYDRNIVLALDADAAGDTATLRGLDVARDVLGREFDPVFDARGMVRYESRLGAEIRVASLPEGMDPDEVVAENPDQWPALIDEARPIVQYVTDVLTHGRNLDDPKIKAEIARQVLPLIADVVDPVEREAYKQSLARRLKVDERALSVWQPTSARGKRKRSSPPGESVQVEKQSSKTVTNIEAFCLGMLLHDPEILYKIDRELQQLELKRLNQNDFTGSDRSMIFKTVRDSLEQHAIEPDNYWKEQLEPPLLDLALSLETEINALAEFANMDLNRPKVEDEVTARYLELRKRSVEQAARQLQFQIQSLQEDDQVMVRSDQILELTRQVQVLADQKSRLEQALNQKQRTFQHATAE